MPFFILKALAHHEGTTPPVVPTESAADTAISTAPDLTILWIIGGIILISVILVVVMAVFSGKAK